MTSLSTDQVASVVDDVRMVVAEVLGITDRAAALTAATGLMGSMPELDSMAVAELLAAIEERFGVDVDDAGLTGDVFDTIGSLAAFVAEHQRC
jgi:acyl carrier protein